MSKVGFVIETGSMENSDERLRLVKAFNNEGFNGVLQTLHRGRKIFLPFLLENTKDT